MPKRNRNHELETESQRAFESALPSSLVVRPVSDDYGVDREVEVFADGKTTGLTFKVQLKGTDKSGVTRRVKRASLDYWLRLDVPVLIVSYESPTKALRARWVHSIGADAPDTGAKTLTVKMDPEIEIAGDWPASLADDLMVLRSLRRGEVIVPTPVRVVVDDGAAAVDPQHLLAGLLNASRRTSSPMRSAVDDREAALTVQVTASRVQVALPLRIASASMRLVGLDLSELDPRSLSDMVLLLAGGAVATINMNVSRAWLSGVSPESPGWAIPEIAERLVTALDTPDSGSLLLDIHANLVEVDDPTSDIYLMRLMDHARAVPKSVFDVYSTRIRSEIETNEDDAGRLAFNLANLHRQRNEHATAVELFNVSRMRHEKYHNDPLLHRGLGGSYWDCGQYGESASAYQRALTLGYDAYELLPLLADSLMHDGRYAEAQEVLKGWKPSNKEADRLGVLISEILRELVDVLGIKQQNRANYDSRDLGGRYQTARDNGDLTRETLQALLRDGDALHPIPWFHLGPMQRDERGYGPAIAAAFFSSDLPHAWVLALLQALIHEADDALIHAIVDQARHDCGEDFYNAVWDAAQHHDEEEAAYLRQLVSAAYAAEPDVLLHHLRIVDVSSATFVVDSVQFPGFAARGYLNHDPTEG